MILTQDLDFSGIVALQREHGPSIVTLRLRSSRIERVNEVLAGVLPSVADALETGAVVIVEDDRVRTRRLPIS